MYVVSQKKAEQPDIWHALADPTRRTLIDRLAQGARTTSELCEGMPMSRFGVMKHLGILEAAGLVIARRQGRFRVNHLNAAPLHALQSRWLSQRAAAAADAAQVFADSFGGSLMPDNPRTTTGIAEVALEWPINASVQRVWDALFSQSEKWWPQAHRAVGNGARMTFEARIGAQLREEGASGGGVIWYTVFALDPMRSVDLKGDLAARYGGPATSLLHIEIAPGSGEQTSLLKITDSVFGRIGPEMCASVSGGWQAILGDGLVAFCDQGVS